MNYKSDFSEKQASLIFKLKEFSQSLSDPLPGEFSQEFYSKLQPKLSDAIYDYEMLLKENPPDKEKIKEIICVIKEQIHYIGAASSKGEIPSVRSDLLEDIYDLMYIYQETKYKDVW